jgi:hypothetical protein
VYEFGTLKPVSHSKKGGRGMGEKNGRDELNWGTFYPYMGTSQKNLYNYYILTNRFFKSYMY